MSGATVAAFTVTSPSSPWSSFNKQNGISGDAIGGDCDYQITSGIQSGINPSWSTTLGVVYASMAIAYTSVVPPAQVTGLNVAGDATNPTTALDLSWSTPSGSPTSYTIQRAATLGGTFSTLATGVTATSYVDSTCSPGTQNPYRSRASTALEREHIRARSEFHRPLGAGQPGRHGRIGLTNQCHLVRAFARLDGFRRAVHAQSSNKWRQLFHDLYRVDGQLQRHGPVWPAPPTATKLTSKSRSTTPAVPD